MSNYYEAAKKDFAVRSGLIQKRQLFSAEQLTEIYRCASNELDNNFNQQYPQCARQNSKVWIYQCDEITCVG
ncbi:MAG: hypothetical protein CVU91_11910 [Firmicutes bacterium HGW-Firmicutes-16]|nr:MAG: hypothetical protein CVU91_11910 [Firmicutes bacterium HGW-Firmicutes-16]